MDSRIELPLAKYQLDFVAQSDIFLPDFPGSAWRGAFGHALRRTVCLTREKNCNECVLIQSCPYAYTFETPPPATAQVMRKYTNAPHPFILDVDTQQPGILRPGDHYTLGLTLIGKGNNHLPYMLYAFQNAAKHGVGKNRGVLELESLAQWDDSLQEWLPIFKTGEPLAGMPPTVMSIKPMPDRVQIDFLTPTRLKRNGAIVRSDQFEFHDLFRNLLRRLAMLCYFHTDAPHEPDFKKLSTDSLEIKLAERMMNYKEHIRYSARQENTMKMAGLVGYVVLDTKDLKPFWPYLVLGEKVHAGAFTCMGLGDYRIRAAES